ncbi:hypothetical protein MKW98_010618 [Papaver atlanticum]|uniref:Uncharacterized protein n=1 Tax=Papaver atlanticum TaxID=357466 RepID=A0AAD4S342_9MAGN|nr:hypothetical protein MKW98_010618 [Papaver atlanticum]
MRADVFVFPLVYSKESHLYGKAMDYLSIHSPGIDSLIFNTWSSYLALVSVSHRCDFCTKQGYNLQPCRITEQDLEMYMMKENEEPLVVVNGCFEERVFGEDNYIAGGGGCMN